MRVTQEEIRAERNRLKAERSRLSGLLRNVLDKQEELKRKCPHLAMLKLDWIKLCDVCGWKRRIYRDGY